METKRDRQDVWDNILFALIVGVAALAILAFPADAHDHHPYHAEFYSKWQTQHGSSCCNHHDCAPIDDKNVRVQGETVQVFIKDEWVTVEPEKIRPYQAPDMNSHLCHVGKHIYCFVYGGGV